jgi:hypothetical protein
MTVTINTVNNAVGQRLHPQSVVIVSINVNPPDAVFFADDRRSVFVVFVEYLTATKTRPTPRVRAHCIRLMKNPDVRRSF